MAAGTPVQSRLQADELGALDRYRREQLNPPSRGKALRELARKVLFGSANSLNSCADAVVPTQTGVARAIGAKADRAAS